MGGPRPRPTGPRPKEGPVFMEPEDEDYLNTVLYIIFVSDHTLFSPNKMSYPA